MGESLRDQLLKAGLVSRKKVTQAETEAQRLQHKTKKSGRSAQADEAARRERKAATTRAAKAARDRELDKARQEKAAARARVIEIRQLLERHRLPVLEGNQFEYFNFVAGRKIRRVALDAARRESLRKNELGLVWFEGRTALVPGTVAARVRELDERAVITFDDETATVDEDDPYRDYVVPDDLRW